MNRITGISADPKQLFQILLPDNKIMTLTLEYKPLQSGWFCSVDYQNFSVSVLRITTCFNILAQFSNLIPFGIACYCIDNREPYFIEDFRSGNATLCILDSDELLALEAYLGAKV